MEEKNTKVKPLNPTKKTVKAANEAAQPLNFSPEQLQGVIQQAEAKVRQVMEQLRQMNQMLTDKTIDQLFQVIKHATYFNTDFVDKCAETIETYLKNVAFATNEQQPEVKTEDKE